MDQIVFLDYAGVAVFAATGALAASRKQLDISGLLFLAGFTGIGGGTVRDLILGVPVFWVQNHDYLVVCTGIAILLYFSAHLICDRHKEGHDILTQGVTIPPRVPRSSASAPLGTF